MHCVQAMRPEKWGGQKEESVGRMDGEGSLSIMDRVGKKVKGAVLIRV